MFRSASTALCCGKEDKECVCASDLLRYREKDKEIGSLQSELAAARHQISVDERASRMPSSIDTAGMSLQAQSQVERLEAANAKLEVGFGHSLVLLSHYNTMGIALRCAGCMCCHQQLNACTTCIACYFKQSWHTIGRTSQGRPAPT